MLFLLTWLLFISTTKQHLALTSPPHYMRTRAQQQQTLQPPTHDTPATAPIFRQQRLPTPVDPSEHRQWGHHADQHKPDEWMRLLFLNPDGLAASNGFRKLDYAAHQSAQHKVDILCLAETNCGWKKHSGVGKSRAIIKKQCIHTHMVISCSDVPAVYHSIIGGTATIVTDKWTGRIRETGSDSHGLGRWSYSGMC